jgi:hypothetical protein
MPRYRDGMHMTNAKPQHYNTNITTTNSPAQPPKKKLSAEPPEEPGWQAMSLSLSITANTTSQITALVLSRPACVNINTIY